MCSSILLATSWCNINLYIASCVVVSNCSWCSYCFILFTLQLHSSVALVGFVLETLALSSSQNQSSFPLTIHLILRSVGVNRFLAICRWCLKMGQSMIVRKSCNWLRIASSLWLVCFVSCNPLGPALSPAMPYCCIPIEDGTINNHYFVRVNCTEHCPYQYTSGPIHCEFVYTVALSTYDQ